MANHMPTTCWRIPTIGLLAAVPYLLLSASQKSVELTTVVNWDGSGLRQYTVSYEKDREAEVKKRLRERTRQFDREGKPHATGSVWVIERSWRPASLQSIAETSLQMTGIIQTPFSIFSYYDWSEQLEIYRETATPVETFGEEIASLRYELKMPGWVVSAAGSDEIHGSTAIWELSADADEYTLTATSRRVRWGYLLFLLYILGFIAFQVTRYGAQLVRNRPRKI